MNKHSFKLVFSKHLGMFVPASEVARSKSSSSLGRRERARRRLAAILFALPAVAIAAQPAGLNPSNFTRAALDQARTNATMMTIQQSADKAIVDWNSLNLNRGETLNFDQLGNKNWQILNLIHSASPSTIAGNINADGHVFLYNSNGIIFGNGAQINVGSLTATTLNIDKTLFQNGFLSGDPSKPVFAEDGVNTGFVNVEAGANINATSGGRVMLLAPNVTNNGVIVTPDGQTILAAGHKIYLAGSKDPSGLLVEVDANDGKAVNLGDIVTQRGNTTLVGYAVQQGGRITATSSVRANGSIILKARSNVNDALVAGTNLGAKQTQAVTSFSTSHAGNVSIDAGSVTAVLPELSDTEEVRNAQAFTLPRINVYGKHIEIDGTLLAYGGNINVVAKNQFLAVASTAGNVDESVSATYNLLDKSIAANDPTGVRIYLGNNANLDVSGVDASAPMSRNQLTIQLFSDQLKDSPLLRGGPLLGKTIYVDARKGTNLTDIAPFIELQQSRTIGEKLTNGGSVNLLSTGDVVTSQGSNINVSGGSVTYGLGSIKESTLVYQGKSYSVATAPNDLSYDAILDQYSTTNKKFNVTRTWVFGKTDAATIDNKDVFSAGYTDGASAGVVTINAKQAVLDGSMQANTIIGDLQRNYNVASNSTAVLGKLPVGGSLNLSLGDVGSNDLSLHVGDQHLYLDKGFSAADSLSDDHSNDIYLNSDVTNQGFNQLNFQLGNSGNVGGLGNILIENPLALNPLGSLNMLARNVEINGNIIAPSATINIQTKNPAVNPNNLTNSLVVAPGVLVSAAGNWANDTVGLAGAKASRVAINGGSISLTGNVSLGKSSLLDASAGAWLKADGSLAKGSAGAINVATEASTGSSTLSLGGSMQAYGFTKGGTLTISTQGSTLSQDMQIGNHNPNNQDALWFSNDFFQHGGFSNYSLTAGNVTIGNADGSSFLLHPTMQTLAMTSGYGVVSNADNLANVTQPILLADNLSNPSSISINAKNSLYPGADLTLLRNSAIQVDDGGSVTLSANNNLRVLGDVTAHGGAINLTLSGSLDVPATPAFSVARSLWVDTGVKLDASGYYQHYVDSKGLLAGKVADAGTINVVATNSALVLKEGSLLNVSGVSGDLDVKSNYNQRQTQYGNAGTININGHNSLILDGDFKASAQGTGSGGTLNLKLGGGQLSFSSTSGNTQLDAAAASYLNPALDLQVVQHKVIRATGVNAKLDNNVNDFGQQLDSNDGLYHVTSTVSADQINQAGFDKVSLASTIDTDTKQQISLASGLNLHVKNSLTLDTPKIQMLGSDVTHLSADYVKLTNQASAVALDLKSTVPISSGNGATLNVDANWLDLSGRVSVNGAANVNLSAASDIRLMRASGEVNPQVGYDSAGKSYSGGWLMTPGNLNLTARQVYPATASAFRLEAQGAGSTLTIQSSGEKPTGVFSAGGALYLTADNISQKGVVKAPFGLLEFKAKNSIDLANVSVTSVATDGLLIPYGTTNNAGLLWNSPAIGGGNVTSAPSKNIKFTADSIKTSAGANVSLAGGGDMFAYEFIPGQGGSYDYLAQSGVYAVLPSLGASVAPYDPTYSNGSSLKAGDAVYLSGISGLPAGTYTLLPARYALLQGAYVVNLNTAGKSVFQGQSVVQPDGSSLVSGYKTNNTGARDAAWSTFKVLPGSIFYTAKNETSHAPSEYKVSSANTYFANTVNTGGVVVRLPQDAGQLTFDAGRQLTLDANFDLGVANGGRGAAVDITNDNAISLVSVLDPTETGALQITADALNHLNAESVLLGGVRNESVSGTNINTRTQNVTVANDSNHAVKVPELIFTAANTVEMSAGATLTTGAATKSGATKALTITGNGALLAISNNNDLTVARSGSSGQGTLNVTAGASINAGRSVVLDSAQGAVLNGDVEIGDAKTGVFGSLSLGAAKINLGEHKNATNQVIAESGLTLDANKLSGLSKLESLNLNSYSNFDVYDTLTLGSAQQNININAAGIAGHLSAGQTANINANRLTLSNGNAVAFVKPEAAKSDTGLNITANSLKLADNTTVEGFDHVVADAGELVLSGKGAANFNVAQTTLNSGRVLGTAGSAYSVASTTGDITTTNNTAAVINPTLAGIAASLNFVAKHLDFGSKVDAPSGSVTLKSTAGDLNVRSSANVDVSTKAVKLNDQLVYGTGGQVNLQSDTNNVNVASGATINVSGAGDADAGQINIDAKLGTAKLAGNMLGTAATGQHSGKVVLDVNTLSTTDLTTLNHQLNDGGVFESRVARVRSGDVNILGTGADAMQARSIEVTADNGSINLGNNTGGVAEVNASASKGSAISLYAKNNLTLFSGSSLDASTTNKDANGGKVLLSTTSGNIDLQTGSEIDLRGGSNAQDGVLHLRALRTGSAASSDVKVTALNATVLGEDSKGARIELEGNKVYTGISTISSGTAATGKLLFSTVSSDNISFMQGKTTILNRLGMTNDARFHLLSGVEVQSASNITLGADWDLSTFRAGGEAGVLTLRAAGAAANSGNITLSGSLSDGFASAGTTTTGNPATGNPTALNADGKSWSYNLVAGADISSANYTNTLATANTTTGNLSLASSKLIRTGTGSINIATGGNLTLGNAASVIYTAGVNAGLLNGFGAPDSSKYPLYLTKGGDININTRGNIVGSATGANQQIVNQWLFRAGSTDKSFDTTWWVRPDQFQQGVATLGGGNINVNAGGDITNFSASAPTTAQYVELTLEDGSKQTKSVINGGGDVKVHADGNINSGIYFVAKGTGDISAGDSIKSSSSSFGTVLAIQDAQMRVSAKNDLLLETTFNPTLFAPTTKNAGISDTVNNSGNVSYFNSYSENAKVGLNSLLGDIRLGSDVNNGAITGKLSGNSFASAGGLGGVQFNLYVYPAILQVAAESGSVNINSAMTLSPSSKGLLNILAGQDVNVNGKLTLSDADINLNGVVTNPINVTTDFLSNYNNQHAAVPLHQGDHAVSNIVANAGNLTVAQGGANGSINSAQALKMVAGQDIVNLNANIQHNNSDDLSVVSAGRDYNASLGGGLTVNGAGNLLVTANRNIDLGASLGVLSNANKANVALPESGASITMLAGLKGNTPDVADYIATYIDPQGSGPTVLSNVSYTSKLAGDTITTQADHTQQYLQAYRTNTGAQVTTYMRKLTGNASLSDADAMKAFLGLDKDRQSVLVYQHYLGELAASNGDQAKHLASYYTFASDCNTNASCIQDRVSKLYVRGENAVASLFGTKLYQGDLTLYNSTIKTVRDSNIVLLAPGGLVNAGLPVAGSNGEGILTEKGGNIGAYVNGDFTVNQSKVITQYGGNITIWSENGNIDAGKGSKTALSVPERTVSTDASGVTTVEFKGVAAGSGIRAQSYDPDGPLGSQTSPAIGVVNLAPIRGQLIVGEAGLEGSTFVFGPNVSNAFNNIDVKSGGSISGGGATASGASAPAPAIADTTKDMANQMQQAISESAKNPVAKKSLLPAFLNIEVIGLGE